MRYVCIESTNLNPLDGLHPNIAKQILINYKIHEKTGYTVYGSSHESFQEYTHQQLPLFGHGKDFNKQ